MLLLGTIDFISKPYDSVILKTRLFNLIKLYKTSKSLCVLESDTLIDLYTKETFYNKLDEVFYETKQNCALIVVKIDKINLIKEQYSIIVYNQLIISAAEHIKKKKQI